MRDPHGLPMTCYMFARETQGASGRTSLYSVDITGRNLRPVRTPEGDLTRHGARYSNRLGFQKLSFCDIVKIG